MSLDNTIVIALRDILASQDLGPLTQGETEALAKSAENSGCSAGGARLAPPPRSTDKNYFWDEYIWAVRETGNVFQKLINGK